MGLVLPISNAVVCGLLSLLMVWMVLSPKVHDGIVIKAGLSTMAVSFAGISWASIDPEALWNGERFIRLLLPLACGMSVVIVGYLWRSLRTGNPHRRRTDFADLETTQ